MSTSRQQLLDSIHPGMTLTKSFFKSIYAKEITWPGFADEAIEALEAAGCSRARSYYEGWVNEYETARDAELKEGAHWYRMECEKEWKNKQKGSEERRKQEIRSMTREELTKLCQKLLQKGIITKPDQFAMAVLQDL